MTNFKTPYAELLKEFQAKYAQFYRAAPGPVPITVSLLRLRLIYEEFGELVEALDKKDKVLVADAVGDLAYVLIGTATTYGVPLTYEGLTLPEENGAIRSLVCVMGALACAVHEEKIDHIRQALELAIGIVIGFARHRFNFDAVFREIHRSNMTKAVPGISADPGRKYGQKLGSGGKGPDYQPPILEPFLIGGQP